MEGGCGCDRSCGRGCDCGSGSDGGCDSCVWERKRKNESKRKQVTVPRCSTRGVVAKKGRKREHKTKQREDTEEK